MRCNDPLQPVAKAAVLHRLPPMVRVQQQSFSRCPRCARLYWPGSHWQRMRGRLDTLPAATRPPDDSQHLNGAGSMLPPPCMCYASCTTRSREWIQSMSSAYAI